MSRKHNIAIFASGGGTNAEAIIQHFTDSDLANVSLIITNNPEAGIIKRAGTHDIPVYIHTRAEEVESESILKILLDHQIDFVVLAGYMRRIQGELLEKYAGKIINIHPALLPKFGGKGMYGMSVHKAVVEANEKESGPTIHYVNHKYDEGDIIAQFKCELSSSDSAEDVQKKVLALEHEHYPKIIERLIQNL